MMSKEAYDRPKLVRHLEHPEVPAHNNYLENIIRPFSQGRRVWLLANNPLGARASANLYSLVATARAKQRLRTASTTGADFARRRQLLVFDRFLARVVQIFGNAVLDSRPDGVTSATSWPSR